MIDGSKAKHATARIEVAERFAVDGLEAPSSARAGKGVSLKAKVSGDASGLKYNVFVKTVVSWVARKTFRPGTASFHVRQGMPLSAFS